MALSLPNFNLTCKIWHGGFSWNAAYPVAVPVGPPSLTTVCQLFIPPNIYAGSWVPYQTAGGIIQALGNRHPPVFLRLPKGTDARCFYFQFPVPLPADLVECPSGSKRLYGITWVDDIHKGFSNEYRVAMLVNVYYAGTWPMP